MGATLSTTNQLFVSAFVAGFGYGDIIQPSLLQFQPAQPNLDDFMEFETIHGESITYT